MGSPGVARRKPWVTWHPWHLSLRVVAQDVDGVIQPLFHPRLLVGNATERVNASNRNEWTRVNARNCNGQWRLMPGIAMVNKGQHQELQ